MDEMPSTRLQLFFVQLIKSITIELALNGVFVMNFLCVSFGMKCVFFSLSRIELELKQNIWNRESWSEYFSILLGEINFWSLDAMEMHFAQFSGASLEFYRNVNVL